jgi:hypothetical protein
VLGSFMPSALLGATTPVRALATLTAQEPPIAPNGCFVASCGKGAPAPALPTLTLMVVSAMAAAAALLFVSNRRNRRRDLTLGALPRGAGLTLFHPPQYS